MAVTRQKAREVCNKAELELVEQSFQPEVKKLTPARLRSKISRARKLQDKFREQARKQHRALKAGRGGRPRKGANVRTELKARIFEETRERFENRLKAIEAGGD
jgi:hypothetical protein